MKKIFFIILLFCYAVEGISQNILSKVAKYDLKKIEQKAIESSKKKLGISKGTTIGALAYFIVFFQYQTEKNKECSSTDLLEHLSLSRNKPFKCYIYDEENCILAITEKDRVLKNFNSVYYKEYLYIDFFTYLKPEYIFYNINSSTINPMYFCYKDSEIFVIYLSDDNEKLISTPLSEIKDCSWLNSSEKFK